MKEGFELSVPGKEARAISSENLCYSVALTSMVLHCLERVPVTEPMPIVQVERLVKQRNLVLTGSVVMKLMRMGLEVYQLCNCSKPLNKYQVVIVKPVLL